MTHRLLFVCLGNICRSPLAEAAFREEAARAGLDAEADSAGTGNWHVGEAPDRRAIAAARRNGVDISHLTARQVRPADFERFDHVAGREGQPGADPYYGADSDFDATWRDVSEGARALAGALKQGKIL